MRLIAIATVVGAIICALVWQLSRQRIASRFVQLIGAAFLGMVVLTHVAERFSLFTKMEWGRPNTAGHYLDLTSAAVGLTLPSIGHICAALTGRKNSN
jgi:MFS family permease